MTLVELERKPGERSVQVAIGKTALEAGFLAARQAFALFAELEEVEMVQAGFGAAAQARAVARSP